MLPFAPAAHSQQNQPANGQQQQDIPDAPSTVQPPQPERLDKPPQPDSADTSNPASNSTSPQPDASKPATAPQPQPTYDSNPPPPMPPVRTVPPGTLPQSASNSDTKEQLYKLHANVNFVEIPVTVKDGDGRVVDGLLPKDFEVLENGKKQALTFFTSDPFELSVAIVIDLGMPDSDVQKVSETYPALIGAFSPYDEVAVYTYSSTVSQVTDFVGAGRRLAGALNQLKTETGRNNGVPVTSGPLAPNGPVINGMPPASGTQPVYTPPKESHVLNDAILEAALDLAKRDKARRKVIFVITDGRELASKASYRDVLRVLLAQGIEVRGVTLDSGALPVFKQLGERIHLPREGYNDLLPRYASATGTGQVLSELTRNSMEDAYADITSEARNQYTLGYVTRATPSSAYREIEVRVSRPHLKIYAKGGYYPAATR